MASRTGKRVLVDVGGNWCGWCHEMERYFETHADLRALRDRNFVTVKVNFSPENPNESVLSKYPKYPLAHAPGLKATAPILPPPHTTTGQCGLGNG